MFPDSVNKHVAAKFIEKHRKPASEFSAQERFQIRNAIIRELFEQETDEVKAKVDEARKNAPTAPLTRDDIVKNIGKVPRILKGTSELIQSGTRWTGFAMVGGYDPSYEESRTYVCVSLANFIMNSFTHRSINRHTIGTTRDGRTFAAFLGAKEYEAFTAKFNKFILLCDSESKIGF